MSEPMTMDLVVGCDGGVKCIYGEDLNLRQIGKLQITRASHVEPDANGFWWADMGPVGGPVLGPYGSRSEALGAERRWLIIQPAFKAGGDEAILCEDGSAKAERTPRVS